MARGRGPKGRGRSRGAKAKPSFEGAISITVQDLGLGGDGIADHDGQRLFLPMTLPGEVVIARALSKRGRGWLCDVEAIEKAAPERINPPCTHFSQCGGCALQHLDAQAYGAFKRTKLLRALARQGLHDVMVSDHFTAGPAARRRASFSIATKKNETCFGFHQRSRHELVDIEACPILIPDLEALIAPLREGLGTALTTGSQLQALVQLFDAGAWELVLTGDQALDNRLRLALVEMAQQLGAARIAWCHPGDMNPEVLVSLKPCRVTWGPESVTVPPGAFLQPTRSGEAYLQDFVVKHLAGLKSIADLFCGLGTFALPLSVSSKVYGADIDADQAQALKQAGGRVHTESRDLSKRPLMPDELKHFDGLVFDPPRKGAGAQCEMIALAAKKGMAPGRVIAVSCDADSFARDARTLADAGFELKDLALVDQFTWSAHIEIAASFALKA